MLSEDPCSRAERLRDIREALISGTAVSETNFDGVVVRYAKADLPALEREIAAAEAACSLAKGELTRRRRRFAMGARFRPY